MKEIEMCCGTTCDKAKVKQEIEALRAERDALAAQVEVLKDAANNAWCNWRSSTDVVGGMRNMIAAVESTPSVCLAQVRSDAAKRAYLVALNNWALASLDPHRYAEVAEDYADRVRTGVIK